jgi:hypothetical protein
LKLKIFWISFSNYSIKKANVDKQYQNIKAPKYMLLTSNVLKL